MDRGSSLHVLYIIWKEKQREKNGQGEQLTCTVHNMERGAQRKRWTGGAAYMYCTKYGKRCKGKKMDRGSSLHVLYIIWKEKQREKDGQGEQLTCTVQNMEREAKRKRWTGGAVYFQLPTRMQCNNIMSQLVLSYIMFLY